MSALQNPKAYWKAAHNKPHYVKFNADFEYFLGNPYSTEDRIYDVIKNINSMKREYDYVTGYEPYYKCLTKLNNIIIDSTNKKIILIPEINSIDDAREFKNKKYNDFNHYIIRNLHTIPSESFINFINSNRLYVIYFANHFDKSISNCEKVNSIKMIVNLINYKIGYVKVPPPPLVPVPSALNVKSKPKRVQEPVQEPVKKKIFINFSDPKYSLLKTNLTKYLSENPPDDKLTWINTIFDTIFSHPEFITLASNNENLYLDMPNKVLVRINPDIVIW